MHHSENPWNVLELDRATAGEREVKRAYARLLKLHRPDQDPEGFLRVNEAYRRVLAELENPAADLIVGGLSKEGESTARAAPASQDVASDTLPKLVPESESEGLAGPVTTRERHPDPEALRIFELTKENLLKRLNLVKASSEMPEFTRLRNLTREHPALVDHWVRLLAGLTEGPSEDLVIFGLHPEDVWLMMREGQGQFAAGVVLRWRLDVALLGRVRRLAILILAYSPTEGRDAPERVQALLFVARAAAFYLPEVGSQLADELFLLMGPGVREHMAREIEMRCAAGRAFSQFGLPMKQFWEHQLFEMEPGEAVDWKEPWRMAALKQVVDSSPPDWEGWNVVRQMVPEDVLAPLLKARRNPRPRPVYQTELVQDSPWWNSGGRWMWILVVLVVKGLILGVGSWNGSSSHSSRNKYDAEWVEEVRARAQDQRASAKESEADRAQKVLDSLREERIGLKEGAPEPLLPRDGSSPFPSLTPDRAPSSPPSSGSATGPDMRFRLN